MWLYLPVSSTDYLYDPSTHANKHHNYFPALHQLPEALSRFCGPLSVSCIMHHEGKILFGPLEHVTIQHAGF